MVSIVFPENTEEVIDAIRGAIGRLVDFYVVASSIACPVCDLDPTTQTSVDSFCPVCSGVYWIPVWSSISISGHITWGDVDLMGWQVGGKYFDGDARVQIKRTSEHITIVEQVQDNGYMVVDDKIMDIKSIIPRGVQSLNRILIDVKERER